jgi:hypothetical protein
MLINLCLLLAEKWLPKNSSNSNIPPSADPNREKTSKAEGKRKPGGQAGHPGTTLKPVDTPDKIVPFTIDHRTLPGGKWKAAGWEKRQVIELDIRRVVTEYQVEVLENERGTGKRRVSRGSRTKRPVWTVVQGNLLVLAACWPVLRFLTSNSEFTIQSGRAH